MDERAPSGRREPVPSILKKSKTNLVNKSTKIKREKVGAAAKRSEDAPRLPHGCTPLMYACQQADYPAVVAALSADPTSVTARDRTLRCALHYCASSGGARQAARAACADRVLMAAPALAGARDADGLTPLHLAVVHGNVPLVQALLAAGADVNATDDEHHTVVHWATVCGEVGALRAVLAAGAEPATPDQHGGYPLHYAAQMCGAPAATDHQSRGAALEVLRALVAEGGARADVRDADRRTPLLWAASAGSAAAVLALHQAGAKVDDADRDGLTALHCAAARGHTEALETLAALCGARVDAADSHGCTPLHYAAALGHADATAALLQHGADADRQDRKGRSPAHTAAAKGQLETIRMLGARGANLWLRNSKGDLPLHEAVASGRRELVKWLLDGRPSQVNATNHEGRTPLHIAGATDNADLCKLLLDRGAEVNMVARSSKNEAITPLDCATIRGHRSTAKYIQMHGGVPASKLPSTDIVIDGTNITGLPTRRITSTKIDVKDRIRIEKREVVELSSPVQEKRRCRYNSDSSEASSSEDQRTTKRKSGRKYTDKRHRRKRHIETQKSFSDGHDSDFETHEEYQYKGRDIKQSNRSHKHRSRSEPSRSHSKKDRRNRRGSESSSDSQSYRAKKKSKRHRKRSKRKSSTSESSSSESSDRKSTKRRGKKTSIHIENDEEKQMVNIVKYKRNKQGDKTNSEATELGPAASDVPITSQHDDSVAKSKQQSETETDTVSPKTNMIVTEAQVHMERQSSQHGSSEITVTMDASNNVSIETANVSVTHKDLNEEIKTDVEKSHLDDEKLEETIQTNEEDTIASEKNEPQVLESPVNKDEAIIESSNDKKLEEVNSEPNANILLTDSEGLTYSEKLETASPPPEEQARKRSFEILSGPQDQNATQTENNMKNGILKIPVLSVENDKGENTSNTDLLDVIDKQKNFDTSESIMISSEDKRKEYANTTASSSELTQNVEKGVVTIIDSPDVPIKDRAVQQVVLESPNDDDNIPVSQGTPKRIRKTSKDSQTSSRKSSIYETESYKVLSDIPSAVETATTGILKTSKTKDISKMTVKDIDRVPSVSDNEIYNSEINGKRKRFRKKSRGKQRSAIRSKSENSERGYESSGVMDSGFEPSPRVVHRRIMSPRLAAYYRQRHLDEIKSGKSDSRIPVRKPGDKNAVDMKSVTQKIQTNMRRYYCERKIFYHLLELKRLQIRTNKTNEAVLVKRAIDEFNKSSMSHVGLGPYSSPDYTFSNFEKFLYESLRKLQKSGKRHLENLPEKPDSFDYGESELYKMSSIPDNPCLCTSKTHRCFHAVHAYTGIPCSAYIPQKWNHHTMPKPSTAGKTKVRGFLPKINSKQTSRSKSHVTLEVSHGSEKQLIALPAEKLDRNKRYYVTFTVKGSEPPSDDNGSAKSVKSG